MIKPKLLFVVTEDWYFVSHRLDLARACSAAGYDVAVATRFAAHRDTIAAAGIRCLPIDLERGSQNPASILRCALRLKRLYRVERPDIVHHVALKPVLAGALAAAWTGVPAVINAVAGLGFVGSSRTARASVLRPALRVALRFLLGRGGAHVVVQNAADETVVAAMMAPERVHLIRGAGVDVEHFAPLPEPQAPPLVAALVGRMLWDKGPGVAAEAARILAQRGVPVRIVLVGRPDPDNPASIPIETLRGWADEGVVDWWGHRDDVREVWAAAHVAILPTSYGEGLPKALLEAAACGRALVASDHPGCSELIVNGVNGLLVPERDPAALAAALERLATDAALRRCLATAARRAVEGDFAASTIGSLFMELYGRLRPATPGP